MQHSIIKLAGVAALAAGMAFGQAAPAPGSGPKTGHQMMFNRMTANLNLTDAQKQQAQSIFQAARQQGQAVHAQLKQNRQALAAAVKAGASDAEIDNLANAMGPQMAQAAAIHAKSMAKFYAILTPEQKTKLDARMQGMMNGEGGMRGRWQGREPGTN